MKSTYFKYVLFTALFILIFVGGFIGTYFILLFNNKAKATTPSKYFFETGINEKTPEPLLSENKDEIYSILLLGYGGKGHSGGYLSDTIIQLVINKTQKKNILITIPRDLWLGIPTDFENVTLNKINSAYSIGLDDTRYPNKKPEFKANTLAGGNLSKYVVGKLTGYPINNFIAIDFDNLIKSVDLLGGIKVDVPKTFTDEFYPIKGLENETCGKTEAEIIDIHQKYSGFELEKLYTCRYEKITFNKGVMNMDGAAVLKFVRSRHSNDDGGDFARSNRQLAVIMGMKDKILELELLSKKSSLLDTLAESVTTDIKLTTLGQLVKENQQALSFSLIKINLSTSNVLKDSKGPQGQYILSPKTGDITSIGYYIREEASK